MILTKKYRLIFKNKEVLNSGEFSTGSKTYVGSGKTGVEFDSDVDGKLIISP